MIPKVLCRSMSFTPANDKISMTPRHDSVRVGVLGGPHRICARVDGDFSVTGVMRKTETIAGAQEARRAGVREYVEATATPARSGPFLGT